METHFITITTHCTLVILEYWEYYCAGKFRLSLFAGSNWISFPNIWRWVFNLKQSKD